MKGRLTAKCCACGLEKGDHDSNAGWWILVSRDVPPRARTMRGLDFCPACAPALLVRSDEAQTSPSVLGRWRLVPILWLHAMLSALRTAGLENSEISPRETLGWRAAQRLARLIGFRKLQEALPCREFGRFPGALEDTP